MDETPKPFDISQLNFWAINERAESGIPACEMDMTTGNLVVLVWTSRDAALKYCYLKKPEAAGFIQSLPRVSRQNAQGKIEFVQSGLIRIARKIRASPGLSQITDFLIDHPGTAGSPVKYLSINEVAEVGRIHVPPTVKSSKDLKSFLDSIED